MNLKTRFLMIATLAFLFLASSIMPSYAMLIYRVKAQDTLWKISQEFEVSMESILEANKELKDENSIKTGMLLVIPESDDEVIPCDNSTDGCNTLILNGKPASKNLTINSPTRKNANIMIVEGKTVRVPSYTPPPKVVKATSPEYIAPYKRKTLASRGTTFGNGIVSTAFRFIGVPYVWAGTTSSGFDCSGFVMKVFQLNGINVRRMAHEQYFGGTPVSKDQLRPGDLVFFTTYTAGISHVGIYIGNGNFIHASSGKGCVTISGLNEQYYKERYMGACRY